jgi:hypothetical protein
MNGLVELVSVRRDGEGAVRGDQEVLSLEAGPLIVAGGGAVVAPSSEGLRPVMPPAEARRSRRRSQHPRLPMGRRAGCRGRGRLGGWRSPRRPAVVTGRGVDPAVEQPHPPRVLPGPFLVFDQVRVTAGDGLGDRELDRPPPTKPDPVGQLGVHRRLGGLWARRVVWGFRQTRVGSGDASAIPAFGGCHAKPCSWANTTICTRSRRLSLRRIAPTWVLTVDSLAKTWPAISVLDSPRATAAKTSRSLSVSVA